MQDTRTVFLQHVANLVEYWTDLPDKTDRERCLGVACSILVVLDGSSSVIPPLALVPVLQDCEEVPGDIAGALADDLDHYLRPPSTTRSAAGAGESGGS